MTTLPKTRFLSHFWAILAGGIGVIGLIGWIVGMPALQRIHPSLMTMKANTAIALILASLGLLLLQDENASPVKRRWAQLFAATITLLALLTLVEYVFNWDLGIDQFFFHESVATARQTIPGRMSLAAVVVFICVGIALVIMDVRIAGIYWASKFASVAAAATTIAFLYNFVVIEQGAEVPPYAPMALLTVVASYGLCTGIFFARPGRGIMLDLFGPSVGSVVARRMLPAAFFLPILLGWFTILGARAGFFGMGFGTATLVVLILLILTGLIRITVIAINRQEAERIRAEAALRRSEANLRDFVDNATIGLHWVDSDGIILWANQAELNLLGYTKEEYIGHPISEFHADAPVIEDILTRLTRGESLNEHAARLRCKDGSIRHVLIDSNVLFEDGSFIHTRCFTRDITESRDADALRARLAAIVMTSNDAIISKSTDGTISTWNPGAENTFGYTAEEMIGQSIMRLVPPDLHDEEKGILERLAAGEPINRYETMRMRKDGSRLPVSLTISPIHDTTGRITSISKIVRDITQRKQAEEALRASENLKSSILDSALDAIITMDHEGIVISFNHAAELTFGFRSEEIVGNLLAEKIIPERLREGHKQGLALYLATGEGPVLNRRIEVPSLHADGHEFFSELSISRIPDIEPPLFTATLRDITERQEAQAAIRESEERMRLATEVSAVGIWEWNVLTGAVHWDAQMFRIYGIEPTPDGMVQYSDWSTALLPDELPENERILNETVRFGGHSHREFRIRRRNDGEVRDIDGVETVRTNAQGETEWAMGTNLDITERRRSQAALIVAKERAEEASRSKDDFLAALSHELRTPLTPVLMMATALGDDPALPQEVRDQLDMMRRNIELEARLIDDLLDLTRITHGKLAIAPVVTDVHDLLDHTAEIVLSDRLGKDVNIVFSKQAVRHHTLADPARIQQVFWNLIKNAIKFSPSGQTITVSTHSDAEGRIAVTVADNGVGISAEAMPNIFKAFEQGDIAGQHRYGGLGLGLAISKAIMEAHGTTISVESPGPGHGSKFTITLESIDAPTGESIRTPACRSTATLQLLIVEDHQATRRAIAQVLTRLGHKVTTAGNIQEALAAYGAEVFDLVISDLGLPDGTGTDLMREIQRIRPVPAIALTGYGMEDDVRRTKEAGFSAHLVKPVNLDQLRQIIDHIQPLTEAQ